MHATALPCIQQQPNLRVARTGKVPLLIRTLGLAGALNGAYTEPLNSTEALLARINERKGFRGYTGMKVNLRTWFRHLSYTKMQPLSPERSTTLFHLSPS